MTVLNIGLHRNVVNPDRAPPTQHLIVLRVVKQMVDDDVLPSFVTIVQSGHVLLPVEALRVLDLLLAEIDVLLKIRGGVKLIELIYLLASVVN